MKARDAEQLTKVLDLLQTDGVQVQGDILGRFIPPKAVQEMSDQEVLALPGSKILRALLGFNNVDDALPVLRTVLHVTYEAARSQYIDVLVDAVFTTIDPSVTELTIKPGSQDVNIKRVIQAISVDERLDASVESITISRAPLRYSKRYKLHLAEFLRVSHSDYASLIGQTFTLEVKQAKDPRRNGTYELRMLPGDPSNEACTAFRAELHQNPADGTKYPIIVYPPAQGTRAEHRQGQNLRCNPNVIEVASMSGMMKASILATPQTPATMFRVVEKLQAHSQPISWGV